MANTRVHFAATPPTAFLLPPARRSEPDCDGVRGKRNTGRNRSPARSIVLDTGRPLKCSRSRAFCSPDRLNSCFGMGLPCGCGPGLTNPARAETIRELHPPLSGPVAQFGSALPWHGRGRRFDPDQVHQFIPHVCWSDSFPGVAVLAPGVTAATRPQEFGVVHCRHDAKGFGDFRGAAGHGPAARRGDWAGNE
jgi:hypothetical protein